MQQSLRLFVLATMTANASAWWRDDIKVDNRAPLPFPVPDDWTYNTVAAPKGIVQGKINVHLVPHTHDDTGWQVTVDQYFFEQVYYVLDTMIPRLAEDPNRRFIYVEIGFFARWWDQQPKKKQELTRRLVEEGRLEFINGGWCMHDEASPYYVEMVDQTTRGHQFIKQNFGDSGRPRGTWQIDPFGHSNTQAWLLASEAGMDSMFWGRTDYQDVNFRTSNKGKDSNHWLEWIWRGSESMGAAADIFAGELGTGGYGAPINFNDAGGQVQDDPYRHDYNVDQQVDQFINAALGLANNTRGIHQMWPAGSDFNYQNADHWYHNLDKLVHYVNINASRGGPVQVMYSTPTLYTDAKRDEGFTWEVREDDIFPLADNDHNYWSGYFTSRPALKKQVRVASNFLNAARQLEVVSGITRDNLTVSTLRPSPPVGTSWTDSLEGTIGVATHHDGMSGTERQDVSNDYEQRISESHIEVEQGVGFSLAKLMGGAAGSVDFSHCNCNEGGNCLNMSVCAFTTQATTGFSVVAWNPLGQQVTQNLRFPVTGAGWTVLDVGNDSAVTAQVAAIDNRTLQLPLLYLNSAGMNKTEIATAKAALANQATHELLFQVTLPPVGFATFKITAAHTTDTAVASGRNGVAGLLQKKETAAASDTAISNQFYSVAYDTAAGTVTSVTNLHSNVSTPFTIDWGFYKSSTGGCTGGALPNGTWVYDMYGCDGQNSGAYMFRPNTSDVHPCGASAPTLEVFAGPLVSEIRQSFGTFCTHVLRLHKGESHIEVEWTAGPIPINQPWIPPPPPPAPPAGQCSGWVGAGNVRKTCDQTINANETGQCNCAGGSYPAVAGQHGEFTCGAACAGTVCEGWKQTAGCGSGLEPSNNHDCNYVVPDGISGFCQCSMGRRVGGSDWSNWGCGVAKDGLTCTQLCKNELGGADNWGKEVIMKYSTNLESDGVFYTDSNGREMMPRKTNGRGPSYPPLVVHEPIAGNYYPVNSMISLNDSKTELVVVTDVSVGGASLANGELELMVHRRMQTDDARGVQEPLNETMCGCNDIGADPGNMGAHGHEADGGCICAGLTMRGKHYVVFDTVENAHALRRQLIETLNFPPTLAFALPAAAAGLKVTNSSMLASALPANIKLMTLTNNYASTNDGQMLLRLSHLYSVGEHPILSQPVSLSLAAIFAKAGLKVTEGIEMSLTANREVLDMDAERRRRQWKKDPAGSLGRGARYGEVAADQSFRRRNRLDSSDPTLPVVIGPMEIKTYLVTVV